jgi:hypothetical protein
MNSVDASIKIGQRLNKLSSLDYRNVKDWQMEEAVNKAVIDWFRRNKQGANQQRQREESTIDKIDDFQNLLKTQELSVGKRDLYIETYKFPKDYFYFKRVTPICSKGNCTQVQIKSTLIEEANVDEYLGNFDTLPSFDFEETFHTLIGNRFRIYHNDDFSIDKVVLTYYRKPEKINFTNKLSVNNDWEWKDDIAEQIIDEACKILSGDFKDLNTHEISKTRVTEKD